MRLCVANFLLLLAVLGPSHGATVFEGALTVPIVSSPVPGATLLTGEAHLRADENGTDVVIWIAGDLGIIPDGDFSLPPAPIPSPLPPLPERVDTHTFSILGGSEVVTLQASFVGVFTYHGCDVTPPNPFAPLVGFPLGSDPFNPRTCQALATWSRYEISDAAVAFTPESIVIENASGALELVAIPEPAVSALLGLATAFLLKRNRHNKRRLGTPLQTSLSSSRAARGHSRLPIRGSQR